MLVLIALSVLLLAVTVFALQNAQAVTVRFLSWEFQSSLATMTIAATAAGMMIAALLGVARRLWNWKHGRDRQPAVRPTKVQ
jgi:lipopolysaccharide assembly protein A